MDKSIKVIHVLRPVMGGMRQHLIGLLSKLDPQQVESIVICAQGESGFQASQLPGATIIPLDIKGDLNLQSDRKIACEILQIARNTKADLIHAHGIKAGLLCLWATFNSRNDFAVVCTFHNQFRKSPNSIKNRFNQFMVATLTSHINHIITVSLAIRKELIGAFKVHPHKITCIYNGIEANNFEQIKPTNALREEFKIPQNSILIGTVARLIPQKGIGTLIKAAVNLRREYPNLYFVVIGDGPFRDTLELETAGAGLKKQMFFAGFRDNVAQLLTDLDIFVLPTLEEGFSIVTLEAMAVKKPVVASRVGGLPEVLSPETGITVPPNDPSAFEAALRELIEDPERRAQMGDAALTRVKQHFSLTRMAEKHLKLYRELIKSLNRD